MAEARPSAVPPALASATSNRPFEPGFLAVPCAWGDTPTPTPCGLLWPASCTNHGVWGGVGGHYLLQRNIRPMLNKATAPTSSPTRMTRNLLKSFSGKPDGADKQRVRSDQGVIFVPPPPLSDCGVGEAGLEQKRKELSDTGTQGKWECWHCSRILCPPHPTSSHCPHPLPPPPRERGPTKYISTRAKWIPHNAFLLNT